MKKAKRKNNKSKHKATAFAKSKAMTKSERLLQNVPRRRTVRGA